jgi:hypothetical protein
MISIEEANPLHKSNSGQLHFFEIIDEIGNIKAKGKFLTME